MTIFIDELTEWKRGQFSAHLGSDKGDDPELHAFAEQLGLRRRWFQTKSYPHYDVMGRVKYDQALALGATRVTSKEWITRVPKHSSLPG